MGFFIAGAVTMLAGIVIGYAIAETVRKNLMDRDTDGY